MSPISQKPRLLQKYFNEVCPILKTSFLYQNPMEIPKLVKISINMGLGAAISNPKIIDSSVKELSLISGQKPLITKSKKSISNFKLREGVAIGAMLTLRGVLMWEFFDRLISVALPRTKDFRGVNGKSFDGKGNYTLGIKEQLIFTEINYDDISLVKGMNVSFVTTAHTNKEAYSLLSLLGMPFMLT